MSRLSTAAIVSSSNPAEVRPDRILTKPSAASPSRSSASISDYKNKVGVEADLRAALITAEECPALDLIRLGTANGGAPPRIELANYSVGRGKPLAGTIRNLAGRRLYLILVDNDGVASRLTSRCSLAATAQRSTYR